MKKRPGVNWIGAGIGVLLLGLIIFFTLVWYDGVTLRQNMRLADFTLGDAIVVGAWPLVVWWTFFSKAD